MSESSLGEQTGGVTQGRPRGRSRLPTPGLGICGAVAILPGPNLGGLGHFLVWLMRPLSAPHPSFRH